jgi:hypothetical protein
MHSTYSAPASIELRSVSRTGASRYKPLGLPFDLRTFLSLKVHEARCAAGPAAWLFTGAQLLLYPLIRFLFAVDEILYPQIVEIPVERPIFIVGSPRSGTTLLFHLLAADPNVASYDLYRMLYPSVTLRQLIPRCWERWFVRCVEPWFAELDGIHPIRLLQPEEDEILFLLLGNSGISTYFFPYGERAARYDLNRFWNWPADKRIDHVRFYHRSLQRLLWGTGRQRYVGKSPHFLGKIDDLYGQYPDACFVYTVRSPYECIPSALSMITTMWKIGFKRPPPAAAIRQIYRDLVALWLYGDERIRALPKENRFLVRYEDLVKDPRAIVCALYAKQQLPMPAELDALLAAATARQSTWRSRHRYSLSDYPVCEEDLRADLKPIFSRYAL